MRCILCQTMEQGVLGQVRADLLLLSEPSIREPYGHDGTGRHWLWNGEADYNHNNDNDGRLRRCLWFGMDTERETYTITSASFSSCQRLKCDAQRNGNDEAKEKRWREKSRQKKETVTPLGNLIVHYSTKKYVHICPISNAWNFTRNTKNKMWKSRRKRAWKTSGSFSGSPPREAKRLHSVMKVYLRKKINKVICVCNVRCNS